MNMRKVLRRMRAARVLSAVVVLALAGSVAVAMGAIPNSNDGTVHLCYDTKDATGDRGGADLSIIDGQANTKGCSLGQSALSINQRGRDGIDGIPSAAFVSAGTETLDNESTDVTSKTLPAGSYTVSASVQIANLDENHTSHMFCSLFANMATIDDVSDLYLGVRFSGSDRESIALQGPLSNVPAGTKVRVICSEAGASDNVEAKAHLNATKVASVQ